MRFAIGQRVTTAQRLDPPWDGTVVDIADPWVAVYWRYPRTGQIAYHSADWLVPHVQQLNTPHEGRKTP